MIKPDKYFLEIQKNLSSDNAKDVIDTIKKIKHSGQAKVVPLIIGLLDKHRGDEIGREVLMILGQLKDITAIPLIIDEIKSAHSDGYRAELIMTCWQSGLDYSPYIKDFTQTFITGDYQTSIESLSVIEEWIHNAPKEDIIESKQLLLKNLDTVTEDRKGFYQELIKLVEGYL